jgi:AcrR family transcriptional regulator
MPDQATENPRSPGRPRDPSIDDAILSVAEELLRAVGYQQLSIEAVAHQAGISRPTVYRRYENKVALVIDLVSRIVERDATRFPSSLARPPDTGSLAGDLEELLLRLSGSFDALAEITAMPSFLADLISHDQIGSSFLKHYLSGVQQDLRSAFDAAAERGEIPAPVVPDVLVSTLIGTYVYHRFIAEGQFRAQERRTLVSLLAGGAAGSV